MEIKKLPVLDKVLFWILLFSLSFNLNKAGRCTDCPTTKLRTESKNITYELSIGYNCQCDWTIPKSMDAVHETAVVLLLQNVSLPIETTSSSSEECSGEIRFPSTSEYKCEFPSNFCLAFATAPSICNINKIREKIPVANHTCDSIIPWNKAGESPYKIQYNARNVAGYTKYFTVQYLVIDCRSPTTTPAAKTTTYIEETARGNSTRINLSLSTDIYIETTMRGDYISNKSNTDRNSTSQISSTSAKNQEQIFTPTTIIIIAASALGLLIILISWLLIKRYCQSDDKKISNTIEQENRLEERSEKEIVENAIYGTSLNDQQGPETIINEIYDTTPDTNDETTKTDDPCLYAVVQKKEKTEDKNVVTEGNDDIVTLEDESSSIYAVVNKDKK
ncbi:uncharacterized protein LOC144429852 [Styela clava]